MDGLLKHTNINRDKEFIIWSPFIVFFAMMGIAAYVGKVPIRQTVLLIATHIAFMLVPGLALVSSLQLRWKSSVSFLSISYFSGYCLCIIAYIVFLMLRLQEYSWTYGLIAFLIGAIVIFQKQELINSGYGCAEGASVSGLLIIAFIVLSITFLFTHRSPEIIGYQNMYQDNIYWFHNCVAATKGYPLPELSVLGQYLHWHVFSNFQVAFLYFATEMEISNLCFISCVWQIFVLVTGTYTIFRENSNLHVAAVCCTVIILTLTQGSAEKTGATYLTHFYLCSLGCSEGQAAAMFSFVAFTKKASTKTLNSMMYLGWILILYACTVGLKAPYGSVLLVGICVVYLHNIYKAKHIKRLPFMLEMAAFILVFFLINQLFIVDNNTLTSQTSVHKLTFSLTDSLFSNRLGIVMFSLIANANFFAKCLVYPATMFLYYFLANGIVWALFLIAFVHLVYEKKWNSLMDIKNLPLFMMAIVGCGLFQFVSHRSYSQVYFLFISYPFALLWAVNIMNSWHNNTLRIIDICYTKVSILLCSVTILASLYTAINAEHIFNTGVSSCSTTNFQAKSTGGLDFTDDDILGLRWIRDNLPQNIVIATNKVLGGDRLGGLTYITSAYSERQVYVEGHCGYRYSPYEHTARRIAILQRFYLGDRSSIADLADDGVDYAVLFKFIEHYNVVPSGLPLVYENDDISVYKIK